MTVGNLFGYQYSGLSSDTKPTGSGIYVNDQFFENDTGNWYHYDGVTWWPVRSTNTAQDFTVTTFTGLGLGTFNSADLTNNAYHYASFLVNLTAVSGTLPTFIFKIQGKDVASGVYYTLLSSAALAATGATFLQVGPSLQTLANLAANVVLPRTWRIQYTTGGSAPSFTGTIGVSLI